MAHPAGGPTRLAGCAVIALTVATLVLLHTGPLPHTTPVRAVLAHVSDDAPSIAVPTAVPAVQPPDWDGVTAPPIYGEGAAVIDGDSGALLYGQNAHRRLPPASITKIVTAMIAIERGNLDDEVTVDIDGPAFALQTDSSIMGVEVGDRLTLRDLLYGLMLPSGNDAAVAIARHIAGSEAAFVRLMNAQVAQLGLTDTHFTNPHGLHDPDHYTSAYDIAQLSLWAMRNPVFHHIAGAHEWTVHGSRTYTLHNVNGLLNLYHDADGVKTGWHEQAGYTIVGSATKGGRRLLVALLDDDYQLADAARLLEWGFDHFRWQ